MSERSDMGEGTVGESEASAHLGPPGSQVYGIPVPDRGDEGQAGVAKAEGQLTSEFEGQRA
jgi:hypothetical protein